MRSKSLSELAPYYFPRCLNNQCPKAKDCLHYLVAINEAKESSSLEIINPSCIPEDNNKCPHFQSSQKIHVAWGINRIYDYVFHKDFKSLRDTIICHFGRKKYYQIYRKESYLTLKDQEYIRNVFRQYGVIKEPTFDLFSDEYNWE